MSFPVDASSVKYPSCIFQTQWRICFHSSHSWCKSLCSLFQCIRHCCPPPLFRNINSASSPNTVISHYPAFWMTVTGIWKTVWVVVSQRDPLQTLPTWSITSPTFKYHDLGFLAFFHLHVLYPSSNSEYIKMMISQPILNAQISRNVFWCFFYFKNTDFPQKRELGREFVF